MATDNEIFAELVGIAEQTGYLFCGLSMEAVDEQRKLAQAAIRGEVPFEQYHDVMLRRLRSIAKRLDVILEQQQVRPVYEWHNGKPRLTTPE